MTRKETQQILKLQADAVHHMHALMGRKSLEADRLLASRIWLQPDPGDRHCFFPSFPHFGKISFILLGMFIRGGGHSVQ